MGIKGSCETALREMLQKIDYGKGPFQHTKRISIELSNLCNYAKIHKKCACFQVKKPTILPEKIVCHILETCQKYDYKGLFAFHSYNEPGIDPRFMMFIKETKKRLPECKIFFLTNGYYLDQTLAKEYEANGVDFISVSAYFPDEEERIGKIQTQIPLYVKSMVLDDRIQRYTLTEINSHQPCFAPLIKLIITCEGKVGLCCMDCLHENTFGSLHEQPLEDILQSERILRLYRDLSSGKRALDLCKKCNTSMT